MKTTYLGCPYSGKEMVNEPRKCCHHEGNKICTVKHGEGDCALLDKKPKN